jgi:hypothetical protein
MQAKGFIHTTVWITVNTYVPTWISVLRAAESLQFTPKST